MRTEYGVLRRAPRFVVAALLALTSFVPTALGGFSTGTVPDASRGVFSAPSDGWVGFTYKQSTSLTSTDGHNGIDVWSTKGSSGCGGGSSAVPGLEVRAAYPGKIVQFVATNHATSKITPKWSSPDAPDATSPTSTLTDGANRWVTSVVVIEHTGVPGFAGKPVYTRYEHLASQVVADATTSSVSDKSLIDERLRVGDEVDAGQVLGRAGNWQYWVGDGGNAHLTHLHFSVTTDEYDRSNRLFYDPQPFLGTSYGSCRMDQMGSPASSGITSLDLAFAIDTTGSMWDDIANVKANATALMTALKAGIPDTRVAVEDFRDFPSRTGDAGDYPYHVDQAFTTSMAAAAEAINGLELGYGGDGPESRYCALMHLMTGDRCAGRGDATAAGPWRSSPTSKVIVYLTDAPALSPEPYTGFTGPSAVSAARSGAFQVWPGYFGELPDPTQISFAGAWGPTAALAGEAVSDGIAIYPIVVGGDPATLEDSKALADATGGKLFTADTASEVAGAISAAIGDITGGDSAAPGITINSPTPRAYLLHEAVAADYVCTDEGSGVASCDGTVAPGSQVDTASVGAHTFAVRATDAEGNAASASVVYDVAYGMQLVGDQQHAAKAGSVIPVKIRLVDADGNNVSSPDIQVIAVSVLTAEASVTANAIASPGRANPDQVFRYSATSGSYVFNLSTSGLRSGRFTLEVRAGDDPTAHQVEVAIR